MNEDVFEAARATLPAWVSWGGSLAVPLAAGCASWVIATASLWLAIPRERQAPAVDAHTATKTPFRDPYADTSVHWMERARLAYGPRWLAAANVVLLPLVFGLLASLFRGPLSRGSSMTSGLVTAAAAFVGPFMVRARHENRLRHLDWSRSYWLRSHVIAAGLLGAHALVAGVVGLAMPETLTVGAVLAAVATLPALVALALGGGLFALRSVGLLRAAPERLSRAVERASARTGRTPREVLVAPLAAVNVYSFPAVGRVVITEAAIEALDDDALTAMLGHALAHLTESTRRSVMRGLFAPLVFVPLMLARPLAHVSFLTFYATFVGAFVVAIVLQRKLRYDFKTADRIAREAEGDAGTYARALAKVYEANVMPAVLNQRNPARAHLYDRMVDAGLKPDLARPAPPRMGRALAVVFATLFATAGLVGFTSSMLTSARPDGDFERFAVMSATGGRGMVLGDLALDAWRRHDIASSVALYRAAVAADHRSVYLPANLAVVLGNSGRCAEASSALSVANERLGRSDGDEGERAIVESATVSVSQCYSTVGPE